LLSLALLPDWCISILLKRVSHQVPGLTESGATVPVKVFEVARLVDLCWTNLILYEINGDIGMWPWEVKVNEIIFLFMNELCNTIKCYCKVKDLCTI
jgi:hypothetical protein